MAEFQTINTGRASAGYGVIDEGLRTHMNKVYGLMSVAMVVTGLVAWAVGTNPAMINAIFGTPLKWVVMFAPLIVVIGMTSMMNRMSAATAQLVFYVYAALVGLSLSVIFAVYTGISITQTFLVTSVAFAGLSLYGYTTKRDLSGFGRFLMMGLFGLFAAMLVNFVLTKIYGQPFSSLNFAISAIGVLIFAGLTAFDTQKIKNDYIAHAVHGDQEWLAKSAIMGALNLYLDFINMFMFILQFLGDRR